MPDLEALYNQYKDQGFVIVGFPANNFGKQEPGTNAQILDFCSSKFAVKFPMMSKISVKNDGEGPQARRVYLGRIEEDAKADRRIEEALLQLSSRSPGP